MVLTPIVSLAATERVTLQRASCVTSFALKEGLGRDIGIVEGWAGDEDEDVNIDSDEKDSGSEGLLPAAENLQLQCAPIGGSSVQLPNSSGMRERTKSSVDTARNEDLAGSKERAVTLNKADCPNVALEDSGLRLFTGKDQVGSFDGGIVENGEIATAPKGVRLGSSSEGSALEGAAKRLDARRFRRDFNVKTDSIPARIKPTVSGAGRMRGSSRSDAKEGEKLPEERDAAGGKAKESSSTPPHLRTTDRKGGDNVAGDTYCKGKRTFREEISKQSESVLLHMVLGGEQINKDSSKKRRLNDLDYAQAVERKSSLRVRGELSKQSEGRMRRETRGCGDAGPLAKIKRARKDEEVGEVGISVPEKQIPPKGGLEKAGKSPALLSTKAGRQKSAADNRNQRPPQVKGNCRKPSSKGADPRYCLSGDGAKKSDSGTAKETFELDSLEKVFERRPTKRKDKENETGDNPESKRLTGQSAVVLDLTDVSGGNLDQKTGKKENGKPVDRRPTRSADRAQGTEKTQQSGDASDESQTCILKQWQQGQRGGFNLRRTPTRIAKKGKDGSDRGHVLLRTKSATVMGTITVVEDTKKDLTNSGGDRHLLPNGLSGVELKMAGAEEIEVLQAEELDGKRKQSSEAEIETNRGLSHGGVIRQVGNLEVKEGTEREGFDVDRPAKSKIQKSTDWKVKSSSSLQENSTWSPSLRHLANIWHPKTPLSQCVAMSVSIADVDPNIAAASVDFLPKEALPRQIYGGNEKVLEEGEIGSSDSDGKQEVAKFAEPVLPREAKGETRFGVCENDLIHEDSKSGTMAIVQHNEPSLSKIQLRLGQSQAAVEKLDNMERIPLSEGVCDGKLRAVDALDTNCHVSPHASTVAGGEKSEPVAVAGGDRSDKVRTFSESASHENDCNERHSVQSDNQVDELCVLEDFPTMSHESLGRDQVGEWQSPSAYKLARSETSELQAVYDLIGEDRSDSEDGRVSDYHNSYCQSCRQGGELLCCDGSGCQITYHLECTEPKLWEVPSGNWYCPMCAHKRLSYGVHAVSKSVESIWDIRNSLQSSDHSRLWPKDVPANDLLIANDVDPRMRGRSLEGARGMHVESSDRVEDECIAAVAVYFDDEEGIAGIVEATSGPQGATQRTDEDTSVQRLTERREWDANVKMSEKSRSTEGKAILGCTLSANQGLKLAEESWDKEYFVKWRGISHAHNTWVGETELAKLSPKGLARFKKKLTDGQIAQWSSEWAEPQRLVDKRVSIPPRRPGGGRGRGFLGMDAQQEWFVKWKGLGYEHCTWEPVHSGVLSDPKVKQLEMMFDRWGEAARQRNHPHRVDQVDKLREESFKQLQSQPEWIRFGKLLPYQLDRLNQLRRRWHHRQNTVIVDQDEQEKSSTTVTFLLSLIEEYGVYRLILVVVPVFEIQCWEADITEYAPQVNTVVYTGGKEARGVIQRFELNRSNAPLRVQVVLTTCDIAFSDFDYLRKIKWEVVVVDESQQFKTAKSHRAFLQFDTGFWLLFISELSKYNVEELQQILFLFHPQSSSSTSTARKQLSGLDESGQLQYLKDQLSEHIVRNSRPDDASGLKLVECWVGTNMTSLQVQLYCNTLTKHYNLLQSGRLRSDPDSPSLHDFVTQLRLCCQHPYLVDPTLQGCGKEDLPASQSLIDAGVEASEKWQLIHAMLSVLHVQHHRVVILSQSLMQLFFLDDYLRQKYGPDSYELVDTRYSALRKNSAVQRFNAKDSIRSFFLLRTGATGFSLKLKDKDIVIIHDSDLNPANDLEYLRKVLHRVDGKVTVFRLYQRFTVEEGSMVYDHQKKLRPDPKPLSVKSLQQLLRWKVQHILELDSSSSEKVQMPKGKHKVDLNDKATQNLKRVANILHGNFDMEFSSENHDEGWTEDDGDSVKEFWFSLLKDRHAELQDHKEQSNPGKGLRQRKRVQYSEEALALAPYSVQEEEEIRRKRRRPQLVESTSISVTHEKKDSSLHSLPLTPRQASRCHGEDAIQDNTLCSRSIPEVGGTATCELEVGLTAPVIDNIAGEQSLEPVLSDGVCEQHTQEAEEKTSRKAIISSVGKSLKKEELMRHAPADLSQVNKHQKLAAAGSVSGTTSQVDSGKRLRMEQKQLLLRMEPELSQIGDILQVASPLIPKEQGTEDTSRPRSLVEEGVCSVNRKESIAGYSQQLLSHVMNNFRMPKEPRELVVMVEMSLCLIASTHFHQVMDHLPAISLVAEKMNLPLKKEEFPSVYSRLEGMCKTFVAHPSALQGDTREEILLDEAAHVNISSQPTSAGTDSPVQIPPICGVSEASPFTNSNLHFSGGKQACVDQNDSLQDCVVLVSKPEMTLSAKDNLVRTELEQSEQPTQAGDCEVIGFKDVDATLHTHSDQLPATHNPEAMLGAGHLQRQPVAVSSEETQPPLLPVGTIRARLKSDRDQLLHSWLAKQKLEVQEFNTSCAQERDACQKSFQKQKDKILATGVNMEQRVEMLRYLGDVYASTLKLWERDEENQRQVMNSTQRDLRDTINALYTKLLQQVTTGTLPDLVSEARSMGLTFAMQSETPKFLEYGPAHTKYGHQIAVPQVQQSAQISLPDQNTDLGLLPSSLRAQTPPQSQEAASPPAPNSQPVFRIHSLPQHEAHLPPQVQLHCQRQPHFQHSDILQCSPVTTFSQPLSQALLSNPDREVSTPEELVAGQLQYSYPSPRRLQSNCRQQNAQTKARSQASCLHLNILESSYGSGGSEPVLDISCQGLERTHSGVEQEILHSPITEHARVSELINTSTTQEPVVSHTSQISQSRGLQTVQIPVNLPPRVTQMLLTPTSLQGRISQSVQASPSLQPRVSHTVIILPPQGSQIVDAPTSLQPRVSHIRRPLSIQHTSRHPPSLYHASAPQVRVQPQLQPSGGQGYSFPSACSSVGGTLLASQTRSNVHSQNVPLGAHSSQSTFGPDPLAHEENRLKREQEKLKLLYNEETTQIKTQYDREATELRRKYEGVLFERARIFEQKTTALKENLEKVDKNQQLAEALKLRSFLDQQKARQAPGHSTEATSGSAQVGRLSGVTAHMSGRGHLHPSHQTNVVRNAGRSIGRGSSGGVANSGPGPVAVTDAGIPNSTSQVVNVVSHIVSWQSSRSSDGQHVPPAGLSSGAPVSSALANCVPPPPGCFSSTGSVSVTESFCQTNPSLSSSSGPFSASLESVLLQPHSTTSSSMQQGRLLVSLQDGSKNMLVASSSARVEHLPSHHSNPKSITVLSSPTAPTISIATAVSSPTVTEAVVVSVSPVLSPVRDQLTSVEFAGNLFIQGGQNYLGSSPLSAVEVNDLLMPLSSENQVSSTLETRVRSGALPEAELEGPGARSHGHKGLSSSQPPSVGLNHNPQTPPVPVIYLSDDDD